MNRFHNALSCLFLATTCSLVSATGWANPDYNAHILAMQKYREGNPREALEILTPLLSQKDLPPALFWNAGVYAWATGDFSMASLQWEEAARSGLFAPSALSWIHAARGKIERSPQSVEPGFGDVLGALIPWRPWLGLALAGLGVAASAFLQRRKRVVLIFSAAVGFLSLMPVVVQSEAVVFSWQDGVELHTGPSADSPVIAKLKRGDRLLYKGREKEWVAVTTRQGATLWLPGSATVLLR